MFEQFQLSIGSFGKDRSAEGFHYLLYSDSLTRELVLGRAICCVSNPQSMRVQHLHTKPARRLPCLPAAGRCTCLSVNENSRLPLRPRIVYLLVISKVVPKIWARTNSAMMAVTQGELYRKKWQRRTRLEAVGRVIFPVHRLLFCRYAPVPRRPARKTRYFCTQ